MGLAEIWEDFVDDLGYIIRFEWLSDVGEFFSDMFEGANEFSTTGLFFGALAVLFVFLVRKQMLLPFLEPMNPIGKIIWGGMAYVVSGVAGYFIGKTVMDNG